MGNRIELPAEDVVPPGPYRRMLLELHQLYRAAGRPGLRSISAEIRANNDLPATLSHEAIRQLLRGLGGIPRWSTLKSLVWVLVQRTHAHRSSDVEVERFRHLWEAAGTTSPVPTSASTIQRPTTQARSLPYTPDGVHSKLVAILAEVLDTISPETIPQPVRAYARYAPDKDATLSTAILLAWLRDHRDLRAAVVEWCREHRPDALDVTGSDPNTAAAAALLLDEDAASYYFAATMKTESSPRRLLTAGPADLDTLLQPTTAHLIVEGEEIYPHLPAEDKLDKLIPGLVALARQTDVEVTIVFDAQENPTKPVALPRGIRVMYPAPPQRVDELMSVLIHSEPPSRPVLVITSNQCTIDIDDRPTTWYVDPGTLAARLA